MAVQPDIAVVTAFCDVVRRRARARPAESRDLPHDLLEESPTNTLMD